MSIEQPIPADFPAGWQALENGVVSEGDILVTFDDTKIWASGAIGADVKHFTNGGPSGDGSFRAVYRRMPCPKQQDTDVLPGINAAGSATNITTEIPYAPTSLPTDAAQRKGIPVYSGFIAYFPKAIAAVAKLSKIGNDQHNPGKPLHWDRSKSGDELDALCRHLLDIAETDTDDTPHDVKVAWRAMANLQKSIETNPDRYAKFFAR
jgi:hypothetical protein